MEIQNTQDWLPPGNILPSQDTVVIDVRGTTMEPSTMSQAIRDSQATEESALSGNSSMEGNQGIFFGIKKESFLQKYWLVIIVGIIIAVVLYKNKQAV